MMNNPRTSAVGTAFEDDARANVFRFVAGVDEVGRGALAGPVVAAAVILDFERPLPKGINDSKKLSAAQRERLTVELKANALAYAIGLVEADEIDRINILRATRRAMVAALDELDPRPDFVLIDAIALRECMLPYRAIIRGDATSVSIAAASIVAKTYRDELMRNYHEQFPQYEFSTNVGYGTAAHLEALRVTGACEIHRKTFRRVLPEQLLNLEEASVEV